jgi:hypothetical protein
MLLRRLRRVEPADTFRPGNVDRRNSFLSLGRVDSFNGMKQSANSIITIETVQSRKRERQRKLLTKEEKMFLKASGIRTVVFCA